MSTESIARTGDELLETPQAPSLGGIFFLPGLLYSLLQAAHRIERLTMRLYAMSDAELAARRISRDGIAARLLEEYQY